MAVPDQTQPNGVKLLIEDYPYANDGLLIWTAIENLVETYVNHYYSDSSQVQSDVELNAWYVESIKVGHADHANATWWPKLNTPKDLSSILTTLIWLASAQHAAIHFGQYDYGGYFPSRPPLMQRLVPSEAHNHADYVEFLADPERYFLSSLPNLTKTTEYLSTTNVLAGYSPDEEYIGNKRDVSTWSGEVEIVEAFDTFYAEIEKIEQEIEKRNRDTNMRNRCGEGVLPYELLMPSPEGGGGGIPNSVTL